jgi:anti-sigma-K factor RskA
LLAWLPWIAAIGFALIAGFLGQAYFAARSEITALREQGALADVENQSLRQRMEAERILSARRTADRLAELRQPTELPQLRLVRLVAATDTKPPTQAIVIWDDRRQEGELAAFQLPPLASDRSYRIWIVDPQYPEPVSAGVFTGAQSTGEARVQLKPAKPVTNAARFVVSVELMGGAPDAPGPIVLSGW